MGGLRLSSPELLTAAAGCLAESLAFPPPPGVSAAAVGRRGPAGLPTAGDAAGLPVAFGLAPLPSPRPAATEALSAGPAAGLGGAAAAEPGATRNGCRAGWPRVGAAPHVRAPGPVLRVACK